MQPISAAVVVDEEVVHPQREVVGQPFIEVVRLVLDDGHDGQAQRWAVEQRSPAPDVGRLGAQHLARRLALAAGCLWRRVRGRLGPDEAGEATTQLVRRCSLSHTR